MEFNKSLKRGTLKRREMSVTGLLLMTSSAIIMRAPVAAPSAIPIDAANANSAYNKQHFM